MTSAITRDRMALSIDVLSWGPRGLTGGDGFDGYSTDQGDAVPDRTREAALERLLDAAGAVPWEANSRTGQFTQATTLEARMTKLGIKRGPGPGTTS